jgi:hypothetical protein
VWRYNGPGAWLVRLNLLIGCAALTPAGLFCFFAILHESGKLIGDSVMVPEGLTLLLLGGIAEAGYAFCLPVLLPACVLLPALARSRDVPAPVRKFTAVAVSAALLVMIATITVFHLGYKRAQHIPGGFF